jgi:2,4-dienoyl-CoA reductase-like NADH-dependent reductase (Old Yellow Enzyme family)
MANDDGTVGDQYRALHSTLAKGGVGLIFTGHCYVHENGKYSGRQTGMNDDRVILGLRSVTGAVHANGSPIFAQLSHAGSQSRVGLQKRIAPSVISNPQTRKMPELATQGDIDDVIIAFADAAARAARCEFDGIHIHAGHGYLLSEFLSPHTNRRTDRWGGSLENRQRLLLSIVRAIRSRVDSDFPVTVKLGMRDFIPDGLGLEEAVATAQLLEASGVQAIEVSAGLTSPKIESVVQYAGLTRARALQDKLFHRVLAPPIGEAYFRDIAAQLKKAVAIPIILVGGVRSIDLMEEIISSGQADFISLARPLIREPNLVNDIAKGRRGRASCTSCNICQWHDGHLPLRCWRLTNRRLAAHAFYRIAGRLSGDEVGLE